MRTDCGYCGGCGFTPVDDKAIGQRFEVRPCSHCNYPAYERWASNHYEIDHWCMDCENIRRGRKVQSA